MYEKKDGIATERALVYLVGCSVNGLTPRRELICAMDWDAVFLQSQRHAMAAIVCAAVEQGLSAAPLEWNEPRERALIRWQSEKNKAIRNHLLMDAERERLFAFCEQLGCWYVPLKGVVLKELYPQAWMRQMADNDILYDVRFQQKIRDWFTNRGYESEGSGHGLHDAYLKPPIYNFEMHTALFSRARFPDWAAYYSDVDKRLLACECGSYERRFSAEDFYVYAVLHAYKHFSGSGSGLRSLLDSYLFCCGKEGILDWAYVQEELQRLGIAEFESRVRALSKRLFADPEWFCGGALAGEEQALFAYCFRSGTYGDKKNYVRNQLRQIQPAGETVAIRTKLKYALRRLFPKKAFMREWCQLYAPMLLHHPILLFLSPLWRICVNLFNNPKQCWREYKMIRTQK